MTEREVLRIIPRVFHTIRERVVWTAAFIEGEGYPYFYGGRLEISVTQKDREPAHRCQSWWGGSTYPIKAGQYIRWSISGGHAAGLMMMIYPFLSARRRDQIKTALNGWRSRPPDYGFRIQCKGGHPYNQENTYSSTTRAGGINRQCRICRRDRKRRAQNHSSRISHY